MYYAYDSDMTGKMSACETTDATATSLTCWNIDLIQSPVFFSIAALLSDGEIYSPVVSRSYSTDISPVQGLQIELRETPSGQTSYAINFQPADSEVPEGFLVDSNETFNMTKGYGWIIGLGSNTLFDQDSSVSPDQSYDTMTNSTITEATWELALPASGTYHVTLCMGDPRNSYGTMKAQVEGVSIIDDRLSSSQRWIEKSADISVNDGRLTLTFTGTDRVQVCWIKIERI
jgi:hypothetical protein